MSTKTGDSSTASSILGLRCPRCREGRVFRSFLGMNETCPVCGYHFEREPGFFVGAMYVSYAMAVIVCAVGVAVARVVAPSLSWVGLVVGATLLLAALSPWLFRYSRVIWLHMMWRVDPE